MCLCPHVFFIPIFSVVFIMDQEQNVTGQKGADTVRRSPRVQNKRKELDKNELKERRKRLRLKVPLSPIQDEESDDEQDQEFAPAAMVLATTMLLLLVAMRIRVKLRRELYNAHLGSS